AARGRRESDRSPRVLPRGVQEVAVARQRRLVAKPRPMTLVDLVARLDRTDAGIVTLDPSATLTWAEVGALARGNAARFAAEGIARGDRVVLAMDNDLEHIVVFLALMALGAIPVSVKPRRGPEAAYAEHLAQLVARYGIRSAYRTLPGIDGV